ncbi:MAG: VWA domain-containing protein [Terracidiphilus sp.]|jgi:VWFA-related protein
MNFPFRAGCAVLLCLPVLACAQQPATPAQPAPATPEGRIHLDVVVTDQTGKPVSGLTLKDFALLDNDQPAKIVSFHAVDSSKGDPPAEVILLFDALNLATKQAAEAQKAIDTFLHQNNGHLAQPVSIYRISDSGLSVTSQPSTDGNAVAAEFDKKNGMRVLWNRLDNFRPLADQAFQNLAYRLLASLDAFGSITIEERHTPGRKVLIWIGDGWPTGPYLNDPFNQIVELSTRIREARITLNRITTWPAIDRDFHLANYLAGVKSPAQAVPRDLTLEVLAAQSGGLVPDAGRDLVSQIAQCIAGASPYYALSFDPPRTSSIDEYHELRVQPAIAALAARTSTGYYNQPAYYDQPYVAAEHLTVEQLEQLLGTWHSTADGELARRLYGVELTERMTGPQLAAWKDRLPGAKSPGSKSWDALVEVADASAFLSLPAAEIPSTAPPDLSGQREILRLAIQYLSQTIPRLPNLFATRTTVSYAEQPPKGDLMTKSATGDQTLHLESVKAGTVLYRNGAEAVDSEEVKGKKPKKESGSLITRGTFGPILGTVILDGAYIPGAFHWSRWEQGAGGPEAVFRFAIPHEKSHFEVNHCCRTDGTPDFQEKAPYHGEIAIDPSTGSILRLVVESETPPDSSIVRSATLVEYGPQDIAGKTYICPLRSVSISRGRRMVLTHEWGEDVAVPGPYETVLNDVSFGDYHIFRSDSRIIFGDPPTPDRH